MNNDFELENMRLQMQTLKNKLNQQEIVNDRLMRRSMRSEVSNIKRRYYVIMALCMLMIPYTYLVFVMNEGLSLAFWIGTSIFMLVCAGATFYNSLNVNSSSMMSNNLIAVGQRMARAKKFDANWLFVGIPSVILWLTWLSWELYQKYAEDTKYMFYGVICGAVLGSIIGIRIHTRTQRQYQDIIDQIEDLTEEG